MTRTIAAAALLSLTMFALPAYAEDEAPTAIMVTGIAAPARVVRAISRPADLTALYASAGNSVAPSSPPATPARSDSFANPLVILIGD